MGEDDRLKYLEELMQPHIPLKELKEIRQEIVDLRGAGYYKAINDAIAIIDKHIKEIEGSDKE
jgi:hypothetical protein